MWNYWNILQHLFYSYTRCEKCRKHIKYCGHEISVTTWISEPETLNCKPNHSSLCYITQSPEDQLSYDDNFVHPENEKNHLKPDEWCNSRKKATHITKTFHPQKWTGIWIGDFFMRRDCICCSVIKNIQTLVLC